MSGELEARRLEPVPDPDDRESTSTELDGPVYEGEIVDQPRREPEPSGERHMSDVLAERAGEWSPVLPAWVRDRAERSYAARWAGRYAAHTVRFHAVRVPVYAGRVVARAPRGAIRTARAVGGWALDAEGQPVRDEAVRKADAHEYMRLMDRRNDRVRWRLIVLAAAAAAVLTALALLLTVAPGWSVWLATAAGVAALGVAGRRADRPIVDTAVSRFEAPPLTDEAVIYALSTLGIGEVNKAMSKSVKAVTLANPIARDGPGWRADVDLPHGVTPGMVMDRRDRLASGLRRNLGCVWPERDPHQHEGRLVLWVGDQDMAKMRQAAWPLERRGVGDVFAAMPFVTDQRGRTVAVTLMFNSGLIGAMPRYGKTFALRIICLILALDVRVQLRAFELKGTGDLQPLEKVAHHYGSGMDDDTIEACFRSLQELEAELERRAKTLQRLPRSVCPENKITPELAARKDLGLHPVGMVIDECQELFLHPMFQSGPYKGEAERIAVRVTRLGPAMGVMLWLATQRPDSESLPKAISANAGIRFCLRVMGHEENDMILGTGAHKKGIKATMFAEKDKGIGWLVGVADDPIIARGFYADAAKADRIADRARGLREAAGTLSGHAIGEATTSGTTDLLDDATEQVAGDDKVWTATLLERLADARPETYNTWTQAGLSSALKARGVDVGQRWIGGTNRQGITVADLTAARDDSTSGARSRSGPRGGETL